MEEVTNWDDLLDAVNLDDVLFDDPVPNNNDNEGQSPLEVIENYLLNDDGLLDDHDVGIDENQFFNDIFVADSPLPKSDLSDEDDLRQNQNDNQNSTPDVVVVVDDDKQQQKESEEDNDDPLSKKRKRQLRNKDAALRSRERKKSYVKELEMKSRYYEDECRRLSSVLQCFMAENQALRFSLHSSNLTSNTTSITRQESAVLFLESLLLGSLLWLMAVVCQLLVLPSQLGEVTVVEEKLLPSPVLRKGPIKASMKILMVGKRFKASRSRIRPALDSPSKVVNNLLLAVF